MPTGYTSDVADGKVTDLRTFALRCARGMGACIMMRDDPWDAPIPERFEPSTTYYDKALAEARAELDALMKMTPADCLAAQHAEREKEIAANIEYRAGKTAQRDRYEAMLAQVEAWETDAEGIKDFMLEQLRSSINFDCGRDYEPTHPEIIDSGEWRRERMERLAQQIGRHEAERAKEVARTEGRNQWIAALRASLPEPQTQPEDS
ncbi:hypothetical protein [Phenylobacterium sp.]|uniref:hypothetical protein n=1 Tax=Phenylobacterium sp. TaxID=1871053 RepID=UPI002737FFDE|nr:hypothetical protein [Phenylobacterium sp.]MDP3869142.1 hypothetical protein [Phenylobacterium sp.]